MTKKVALIACSNGLGHVRRLIILSQALIEHGAKPTLFAPLNAVTKLTKSMGVKAPEVYDFDSHTTVDDWLEERAFSWYKYLPDLSDYDQVVSDNLVEILLIRPDAWLLGSFLWHETLYNFNTNQRLNLRKFLSSYRPKMISSMFFSAAYLAEYTRLFEVGLFSIKTQTRVHPVKDKNMLIACGKGGNVNNQAKQFVKLLTKKKDIPFDNVYIDPDIIPNDPPIWIIPATFTREMYDSVCVAIVRPGVGTITDALSTGSRIFTFFEKGNSEMQENAKIINYFGVGYGSSEIEEAWKHACDYCKNNSMQKNHERNIGKLDFNGAEESVQLLLA